ncbi:coiled-coil domain-containing protein 63-like [Odontesthes bonariensis]|uniref:coiled-coil domain-containing protein 63-like n=1 Tax=Odontesthes bonariensis TaxID=219752 RepID=UPI003F581D5D
MSPGRLPLKVLWESPTERRPQGRPRIQWRDHTSLLNWEHHNIPQKELENVAGAKDVSAFRLRIDTAERKIIERLAAQDGILQLQRKLSSYQRNTLRNLDEDTIKFDVIMQRNIDCRKNLAHMLKLRETGQNIEKTLDQQLEAQQDMMEKLEDGAIAAFNQRSNDDTQMLEMKESLEEEMRQFSKKMKELRVVIEHDAKLQTFMEKKVQEIILSVQEKDSKKKERTKQLEMYRQCYNALVEANGESNLSQIGLTFEQSKQINLVLMNYISELHSKWNMLETSIAKIKSDTLILEQGNKQHEEQGMSQIKDLESELENHTNLADSLEEQHCVIQKTVDQLKASISVLLDEIDEPVPVTSDNITYCIDMLVENITNLLINPNSEADEQNLYSFNFALLPDIGTYTNSVGDIEAAVEMERSRTSSGSSFRSTSSGRK